VRCDAVAVREKRKPGSKPLYDVIFDNYLQRYGEPEVNPVGKQRLTKNRATTL
jgi:hypothetical protein